MYPVWCFYVMCSWHNTMHRLTNFNWSKFAPITKVDEYPYKAFRIKLTYPWQCDGLGVVFALGTLDLWVGWPPRRIQA